MKILPTITATALLVSCSAKGPPQPARPPEIAGQEAPANQIPLDLGKRYDIWIGRGFLDGGIEGKDIYRNVRIIGFTGGGTRNTGGSMSMKDITHFNGWLVLQRSDGRKIFLPAGQIARLEES